MDKDNIRRQLQARHSAWKDPTIRNIVANAAVDSVYPTWITPELPRWSHHRVVLTHALQPSSGQGASQALEDAQILSLLLLHYLGQSHSSDAPGSQPGYSDDIGKGVDASVIEREAIDRATDVYSRLRKPRLKRIADRAKYAGDMKRKTAFLGNG